MLASIIVLGTIALASLVVVLQFIAATSGGVRFETKLDTARSFAESGIASAQSCLREGYISNPMHTGDTVRINTDDCTQDSEPQTHTLNNLSGSFTVAVAKESDSLYRITSSGIATGEPNPTRYVMKYDYLAGDRYYFDTTQMDQRSISGSRVTNTLTRGDFDITCMITRVDGVGYCMGSGSKGQIGNGSNSNVSTPQRVSGTGEGERVLTHIDAGYGVVCAVSTTADIWCWGTGSSGQLGNGTNGTTNTPVKVNRPSGVDFQSVSVGGSHVCAVAVDGRAYCWGSNNSGQLGSSGTGIHSTPKLVSNGDSSGRFTQVDSGTNHTCAIGDDERAYCWGHSGSYRLGRYRTPLTGSGSNAFAPQKVHSNESIRQVAASSEHSCMLSVAGIVYCWGNNNEARLGLGSGNMSGGTQETPKAQDSKNTGSRKATSISVMEQAGCATYDDGRVYCWGMDDARRTNLPSSFMNRWEPQYANMNGAHYVTSGIRSTCLLTIASVQIPRVRCWGNGSSAAYINTGTQLGQKEIGATVQVGSTPEYGSLALGQSSACGLTNQGEIYCWGSNELGQLGSGNYDNSLGEKYKVDTEVVFKQIRGHYRHFCGVTESGQVHCWGSNAKGQIETSGDLSFPSPVHVDSGYKDVVAGVAFTCGLKSGDVFCWGDNTYGQLGRGSSSSGPFTDKVRVNIPSGERVVQISAGSWHACALTDSGRGFCWGYGYNTSAFDLTMDPAYADHTLIEISSNRYSDCALTAAGRVLCWGRNMNGSLGTGVSMSNTTAFHLPRVVGGAIAGEFIESINSSGDTVCVIAKGGANNIYCWGSNSHNQISSGASNHNVPVLVPKPVDPGTPPQISRAISVRASYDHMCYLSGEDMTKARIYCRGSNSHGQLGRGDYSDTPVTSFSWSNDVLIGGSSSNLDMGRIY